MDVTEKPARRSVAASARATLREVTDIASYRAVASQVKYPVGAMLISQTVLTFGLAAVLSRLLGARAFGEYAVVITIAGVFQLVAAFPVEQGIPKFLAEARQHGREEIGAYYAAGLWTRLAAGSAALLLAVALSGWLGRAYRVPGLTGAILVAALFLCLLMPISLYFLACIQGMERPRRWATGSLVSALLVFPLAVVGALGFARWGHPGLLGCLAVGWLLAAGVCAALARGALGFLWAGLSYRHLARLIPFLLPVWLVPLFGFGSKTIAKSYLALACGPVPVGQFEIALTLLLHMGMIHQACMIVLLPAWARLYARREGAALLRSVAQARGALIGAAIAYGAVLAVGGHWVVPAVFGPEQSGAVPAVRAIGVAMPLMISGWVASATNIVSDRTVNIGKANIVWFSLAMPVSILLIPRLGAFGAAVGWLVAYAVFAWFYISRARPFFREIASWAARGVEGPATKQ